MTVAEIEKMTWGELSIYMQKKENEIHAENPYNSFFGTSKAVEIARGILENI